MLDKPGWAGVTVRRAWQSGKGPVHRCRDTRAEVVTAVGLLLVRPHCSSGSSGSAPVLQPWTAPSCENVGSHHVEAAQWGLVWATGLAAWVTVLNSTSVYVFSTGQVKLSFLGGIYFTLKSIYIFNKSSNYFYKLSIHSWLFGFRFVLLLRYCSSTHCPG